ncbi:hypothetical protein FHX42_004052 [Saccharopolyspora lacisalsi]|uniref:Uncharacterized protein n=1 Tax=Halosaccharopolyspora lacisalsi TaxID=1000566 RepID=A0A839E067_9PSEU|nr:hypothetical protein [Halosaccharopolyspora lacisalsi]MBA8826673.1 hypothetical protein [Halosaccharopolyspora lacisalsi]
MSKYKTTYLTVTLVAALAVTALVLTPHWGDREQQTPKKQHENHKKLAKDLPALRGRGGLVRAGPIDSGSASTNPDQLGTLRGTYTAARVLAAAGALDATPKWIRQSVKKATHRDDLPESDKITVALVCERLVMDCGDTVERGQRIAKKFPVPSTLTRQNMGKWTDAMVTRFEFGFECPETTVQLPNKDASELSEPWLHALELLGHVGCEKQLRKLVDPEKLMARTSRSMESGKLVVASRSWYTATLAGAQPNREESRRIHNEVQEFRASGTPGLFSSSPEGAANIDATLAGYTLLGLTAP